MDCSNSMSVHHAGPQLAGMAPFQVSLAPNTLTFTATPKKRRIDDEHEQGMKENRGGTLPCSMTTMRVMPPRRFLAVPGGRGVFHTEEWREKQAPLYLPIMDDLLVNTIHIEQLSFMAGFWFLADEMGNYCSSQEGNIINLWRYDEKERKLFIARSLLFTDEQIYESIRRQLEEL